MSPLIEPPPSRGAMRQLLGAILRTDADLDAFCLDFFAAAHSRFSAGMDRISKVNLLLELYDTKDILEKLKHRDVGAFKRHAQILNEDNPRARAMRALELEIQNVEVQKERLIVAGLQVSEVNTRLLALRRQQRQGPQLSEGEILAGRYKLLEIIGYGGFATVWQAYDRKLQQVVAVKVLHGQWGHDRSRRERFERGARKMAALQHPHIVHVLAEVLEDQGFFFFVMEYQPGGDLFHAICGRRLTKEQGLALILQAGDAIRYAHERGLIHRDIKPRNILLDCKLAAKITDFDLVHGQDTTGGTRTGPLGSFLYAAPEIMQDAKEVTPAADVYSLAMTAIFVLYGKEPAEMVGDRRDFLKELVRSTALLDVLLKATERDPKQRFPTVAKLCAALANPKASEPSVWTPHLAKTGSPRGEDNKGKKPEPSSDELRSRPSLIRQNYYIITVGMTASGKTALTLKWANPFVDIMSMPPTVHGKQYEKIVSSQDRGDGTFCLHTYVILDYPGEAKSSVRDALQSYDAKALLLVVDIAETVHESVAPHGSRSRISETRIAEQLMMWNRNALEFLFSEEIQKHCKKYILFINKIDILQAAFPQSDEELDRHVRQLYGELINNLHMLGLRYGVVIRVITGSARTGRGCPELYKELLADILPEEAKDPSLQYILDA